MTEMDVEKEHEVILKGLKFQEQSYDKANSKHCSNCMMRLLQG